MHLKNLRNELAELDISIVRQRTRLQEMEQRQAAVRAEIDAFVFPILTLPPEITAEIFLHYAFGVDEDYGRNVIRPREILTLLTVCRAWRKVALSVPALWATLDVGALPIRRKLPGEMEEIVDRWFSRAGTLPLSLDWHAYTVSPWKEQLNNVLRRHAPHLQLLNICISLGSFSHLPESLPFLLLENLDISNLDPDTHPTLAAPLLTFREAPRLRSVDLERISPASLILPWQQLESFSATSVTPQECLDVFRMSPSLRKFEFHGSHGADPAIVNDETIIVHARLTSFWLCNRDQEIMQHLALPALEELGLESLTVDEEILVPFLSRSRGSVRRFLFSGGPLLSMQYFRHMPSLTTLGLHSQQAQSRVDFVRALNRQYNQDFLPMLKELTLMNWKLDDIDTQLFDALGSRRATTESEGGHARMRLTVFELIWMADYSGATVPSMEIPGFLDRHAGALRDLQGCGMKIRIDGKNYL
jgi:hypothetical protein